MVNFLGPRHFCLGGGLLFHKNKYFSFKKNHFYICIGIKVNILILKILFFNADFIRREYFCVPIKILWALRRVGTV